MKLKAFALFTFLFASSNVFAGWIYADDFELGTPLENLDGISLSFEKKLAYQQPQTFPLTVQKHKNDFNFYPHNHFGGGGDLNPLYVHEAFNAPLASWGYGALNIAFSNQPINSFSFKAEWSSGSPIGLLAYDEYGTFKKAILFSDRGSLSADRIFDKEYHVDFDFNVGSIKLGSMSDVAFIYAINASVPEPSPILLLLMGLLIITFKYSLKISRAGRQISKLCLAEEAS